MNLQEIPLAASELLPPGRSPGENTTLWRLLTHNVKGPSNPCMESGISWGLIQKLPGERPQRTWEEAHLVYSPPPTRCPTWGESEGSDTSDLASESKAETHRNMHLWALGFRVVLSSHWVNTYPRPQGSSPCEDQVPPRSPCLEPALVLRRWDTWREEPRKKQKKNDPGLHQTRDPLHTPQNCHPEVGGLWNVGLLWTKRLTRVYWLLVKTSACLFKLTLTKPN